jgi:4-carboxymuconolactone decarboxylase
MSTIIPKSYAAPAEHFTGNAWIQVAAAPENSDPGTVGKVTFEPKARTNWHKHSKGQILIVTEGTGYYQEEGKPVQTIQKGDVIMVRENVVHWHGASEEGELTYVAVVPSVSTEATEWMQPVTDDEYQFV